MTKITVGTDCGNAPKKILIKDFNIAFANRDMAFITDCVTDDITWEMVGGGLANGKTEFVDALTHMKDSKIAEMKIHTILTHGREGAANGEFILENGQKYGFCDVYRFRGAKGGQIASITSYVLRIS